MHRRTRAIGCWVVCGLVGLAFLVGPAFTHRALTAEHIAAHFVTGPLILALAVSQLLSARHGRSRRSVDVLLGALGIWLACLPFAIPVAGLHIPAHVAAGVVTATAASWNALAPPV